MDLYAALQVHRGADRDAIRSAYRAMARRHHPDFGGDPKRMAAINTAWAVLGDAARRAAYDAEPQGVDRAEGTARPTATAQPGRAGAGRAGVDGSHPPAPCGSGTVLDFGRYAGWTVQRLADHDPDYLAWLARTPIGRRYSAEIEAELVRREARAEALQPAPAGARRRGLFRAAAALGR